MAEPKEFYTIQEFADKLRIHHNTVRKAIQRGRIQAFRVGEGSGKGGRFRIPNTEIQRLCELDMTKLIEQIVEKKLEERDGMDRR